MDEKTDKPEEQTEAPKPADEAVQEQPPAEQGDVQEVVAQQETAVEAAVAPTTEPAVEPATETAVEPAAEPSAEPVVETATKPAVEPATKPAVEPVVGPAATPTAEPVVPPAAEPAVEAAQVETQHDTQHSIQQELEGLEQPQVQDPLLDELQDAQEVQEAQAVDSLLEQPKVQIQEPQDPLVVQGEGQPQDPLMDEKTEEVADKPADDGTIASVDSLADPLAPPRTSRDLVDEEVIGAKSDKEMTVTFEEPQVSVKEEATQEPAAEEAEASAEPAEQAKQAAEQEAEVETETVKDLFEHDIVSKKSVKIDEPVKDKSISMEHLMQLDEEHEEGEGQAEGAEELEEVILEADSDLSLEGGSSTLLEQNVEEMLKQYEDAEDVLIQSDIRTSVSIIAPPDRLASIGEIDDEPIEDVALPDEEQDKLVETSMDAWVEDKRDFKHEFDFTQMDGKEGEEVEAEEEGEGTPEERTSKVTTFDDESEFGSDEDDEGDDDDVVARRMQALLKRRKSRKLSMFDGTPRIPQILEGQMVTGDFKTIDPDLIFAAEQDLDLDDYHSEEEEEKPTKEVEQGPVALDRQPYLERHAILLNNIRMESMKNFVLQRKLIDLMRKRKMDAGLREGEMDENVEFVKRYKMQLIAYEAQEDYQNRELQFLNDELDHIKKLRDTAVENKETLFKKLQEREREVGTGLIYSKTGKTLPDKTLDNLIMRQQKHQDQICSMRLKFIKLKNKVAAIQVKLQELELIDGHLSLMDYEALKLKFRGYVEKLEEREDELNKLRVLCQNSIQILAHYKEKSFATDADLNSLMQELDNIETEVNKCRENLNNLKQERDNYRNMTYNLREESGLLTKPDLLYDMEDSIEELKELSEKLEKMEQDNAKKKIQVRNIRKNIEIQSEMKRDHTEPMRQRSKVSKTTRTKKDSVILPSEAFQDLHRLPKPNPCLKKLKIKY